LASARARAGRLVLVALCGLAPLVAYGSHGDPVPVVTQALTIPTTTPTDTQFLAGAAGPAATVGGELRLPLTPGRIPAVILLHGSTGVSHGLRKWADTLNGIGLATLIVDSFTARGITQTSTDLARLGDAAMLVDAYRALAMLAANPRVDGRRVAVLGVSKGAWAALYASVKRFQRLAGAKGEFGAYLALYPACAGAYLEDEQVSARPIRVFHGTADDWAPIEPCREYVARLRRAGADASLAELAGARHFFDVQDLPALVRLPAVQRRSCIVDERTAGVLVDRATGRPPAAESCLQTGASMGHDARALEEAVRRVKETLVSALGGS
jgi:dienelactone hydrolase